MRLKEGQMKTARFIEGALRRWEILFMSVVVLLPPILLMTGDPVGMMALLDADHIRWKLMGAILALLTEGAGLRSAHKAAGEVLGKGTHLERAKVMARGTDSVFFLLAAWVFWLALAKPL